MTWLTRNGAARDVFPAKPSLRIPVRVSRA